MGRSTIFSVIALTWVTPVAFAATQVAFIEPDKYTDVPFAIHDRDAAFKELESHLVKLGSKLPAGQSLKVEVLDIDMAGRAHPSPAAREVRILRGTADWPAITLRYRIVGSDGKSLRGEEIRLTDLNYMRGYNPRNVTEPLRYEKRMLDEWFTSLDKQ